MSTATASTQSIRPDVLYVLDESTRVAGNVVYLTGGQLERTLYERVNEVLDRLGGRWDKKIKGHVFDDDPRDRLALCVASGEMPPKNPYAFFRTPPDVVDAMLDLAAFNRAKFPHCLEPSAGDGAVADMLRDVPGVASVTCVEVEPTRAAMLRAKGHSVIQDDFLAADLEPRYDRCLMNPPFAVAGNDNKQVYYEAIEQDGGWLGRVYRWDATGNRLIMLYRTPGHYYEKADAIDAACQWCEANGYDDAELG